MNYIFSSLLLLDISILFSYDFRIGVFQMLFHQMVIVVLYTNEYDTVK